MKHHIPVLAAYKNFSVKNSTKRYVGIWHARVLSLSIEDRYPGDGGVVTSLKLSIGEPGTGGYSSELQVPWSPGYVRFCSICTELFASTCMFDCQQIAFLEAVHFLVFL